MYLETIQEPADLKRLSADELAALAHEARETLIEKLSRHGGHVGPNLGAVEATVALHYVFDSPRDKIVFDVSHQSYTHKMLTGRLEAFADPAHYDDVTGFTSPYESEHDLFTVGHTSTSVTLACGLAKARDLAGRSENVIAFIGDGSLSGGQAFEGLDFAAELGSNLIVAVNDNGTSIAPNVGGLYGNLALLRETDGTAEDNYFKALGLDYRFLKDGNDLSALVALFESVRGIDHPVVLHIVTQKGLGYAPAMADLETWHSTAPFDPETGAREPKPGNGYAALTADHLLAAMEKDPLVVALTAATPAVFGFDAQKRARAGKQFVDVGIAEQCAVSMAAAIARGGGKPVLGVQSTFLQRAYDQLSHDLCLDSNPASILVFSGSVFAVHDVTHHGFQDVPMLTSIPSLVYLAPATKEQYLSAVDWSIEQREHPVAIKVPGGPMVSTGEPYERDWNRLDAYEVVQQGERAADGRKGAAILGLGTFLGCAQEAADLVQEASGVRPYVVNPLYASGLDEALLDELARECSVVVTIEDGYLDGGFGEKVARYLGPADVHVRCYGLKKAFRERYDVQQELVRNRLTAPQIAADVLEALV